ncbi:MAG: CTP synthase [Verrucomicrobiota bacterium]
MARQENSGTRHIFITGGVVSSLGKGITAASLAFLLKRRGYSVRIQKLDPYLNVDPGTMSPYQHGEVYVTEDGAETDLDLGHYERFAEIPCSQASNFTTGRIYSSVIARERRGEYLGKTVQVIPHITDEIKNAIRLFNDPDVDIAITEIGGTVGDIESMPFLEAIRQYRHECNRGQVLYMHLTLVPYIRAADELKTKPSQQSVRILREIGLVPDILLCRSEKPLTEEHFEKLALFCNVSRDLVFEELDVSNNIYEIPLELAKQDLDKYTLELLNLHVSDLHIEDWNAMVRRLIEPENGELDIAVVGKYISLKDAYKSIFEALTHGSAANNVKLNVHPIEAEDLNDADDVTEYLKGCHAVLIPGGFGTRGIEGKIRAVQYAREHNIPFFGICLGMQCAVIEFARNVCAVEKANSREFDPDTPGPVIDLMEEQKKLADLGGTMRLGAFDCKLKEDSQVAAIYGTNAIRERHRHRYEFNNDYTRQLEENGMSVVGTTGEAALVEIVEVRDHPWFIACQFHPEFKSTPLAPHPLFHDFIAAAVKYRDQHSDKQG